MGWGNLTQSAVHGLQGGSWAGEPDPGMTGPLSHLPS